MDTTTTSWLPPNASTTVAEVDPLLRFLVYMSFFFFALIVVLMLFFAVKYRRRRGDESTTHGPSHNTLLEATWILIPSVLVIIIFVWGFRGYMRMSIVPAGAMEVKVTAQKWFWSFDYPEGIATVNELVVPVDKPVKLLMSSKDVIHSFFVPAFRVKRDVLPNRYTIGWFQATRPGEYNLFCAEYCGSKHSQMLGKVRVLGEREYHDWLEGQAFSGEGMSLEEFGRKLYVAKACATCHSIDGKPGNGPSFLGIYGHEVQLNDGSRVTVDENYIRESVLNPMSKVVGGFQPIMPTYQGLLKEREIDALTGYIKSLGKEH